jgi:uncharacterized protein (TIGR02284 family)
MATDTLDHIDKLIETCRDGQEGYREAAEHTKDPDLRKFFDLQSLERARFAGELENIARRLGESNPNRRPSMANKLHRAWINLKEKLGAGDASILESVEAGEDKARNTYQEVLQSGLPADVFAIVEQQAQFVFAAHDRVRTLRDEYKKAA